MLALNRKNQIVLGIAAIVALWLSFFSLFLFLSYSSGTPGQDEIVKGVSSQQALIELPQPPDSQEISRVQTKDGFQLLLRSERDPDYAYQFYKSFLTGNGWEAKTESKGDKSHSMQFEKGEFDLRININQDLTQKTLIGAELSKD